MPTLTLPRDLADEAVSAFRYWPGDATVRWFQRLVQTGAAWSPSRPRQLLAIAEQHAVAVRGPRYVAMLLTGFRGPQRQRMIAAAITRLRQAINDIAEGRESALACAGGKGLLVLDE